MAAKNSKKQADVVFNVKIPQAMNEALKFVAAREERTLSQVVRFAVRDSLLSDPDPEIKKRFPSIFPATA